MSKPGRTILLLEDDDALSSILIEILQEAGYSVLSAATPQAALSAARAASAVEVVIADVALPGVSGAEVVESIKEFHRGAGILYISGYIEVDLGRQAARASGSLFLQKPFAPAALLQAVKALLGER